MITPRNRAANCILRGRYITGKSFILKKGGIEKATARKRCIYQAVIWRKCNVVPTPEAVAYGEGWDGTYKNTGKPLNGSVFVFLLKGEFEDGGEFNESGNITLIK